VRGARGAAGERGGGVKAFLVGFAGTMLIVLGLLSGDGFWRNAGLGMAWFTIALTPFLLVAAYGQDAKMAEARAKLAARPQWRVYAGRLSDALVLLVLAGTGHWVTWAFYLVHGIVCIAVEERCKDLAAPASGEDGAA
jgi:hypothetical protein